MAAISKSHDRESAVLGTVLYVEDNAINAKVVRHSLRGFHEVIVASNAKQACDALRAHRDQLVAVLMDIELQGSDLDGVELTRLFRGKLDTSGLPVYAADLQAIEIPIIIVTAYIERYSSAYLAQAGATASLAKPVNLPGLRDLLTDTQ